ncbi:MAG: hypothetical protein PHF18_07320 [Methanosarcina sp.]|uniref:hypothetical protein n=1 Tax=Methanosarcina sp. TaxID=2213 RepID=UPI00261B19C7|nr:hypothetical protein [Methanosarcina sp.]MDD3246643.1 hypothetical protein [Methanosarcina sp.]MDD4249423.1 hypothetical protein [Methanosarcina sp.]
MIRKNVSMEDEYLQKLQPFLDKNNGNLSAAIRDAIELADAALQGHGSVENALEYFTQGSTKYPEIRNSLIESGEGILISQLSFRWLIENTDGILVDDELVSELFNPYQIKRVSDLMEYLNTRSRDLGWEIKVSINTCEENETNVIMLENGDPSLRAFLGELISIFLGRYLNMDVSFVHRKSNSIRIFLKEHRSDLDIPPGIRKNFGTLDYTFKEIRSKPEFWISLVERYRLQRYQRINLNKDVFESFLSGEIPDVSGFFEASAGKPIREIPLCEMFGICKKLVSVTQLASDVERIVERGKTYIKIRHQFSEEIAIEKLVELFSKLFHTAGHIFEIKTVSNLVIIEFVHTC